MAQDLVTLFKRGARARSCPDCGEARCLCLRTQQLEDRQRRLDYWLEAQTEQAYAEARARLKASR